MSIDNLGIVQGTSRIKALIEVACKRWKQNLTRERENREWKIWKEGKEHLLLLRPGTALCFWHVVPFCLSFPYSMLFPSLRFLFFGSYMINRCFMFNLRMICSWTHGFLLVFLWGILVELPEPSFTDALLAAGLLGVWSSEKTQQGLIRMESPWINPGKNGAEI